MSIVCRLLIVISIFGFVGCSYEGRSLKKANETATVPNKKKSPKPPDSREEKIVGFAGIKAKILDQKCVGCHKVASEENHQIVLSSYKAIVEADIFPPLVIPGNAVESSLFDSVIKGRMPKGQRQLSKLEIDAIKKWILDGLPDANGNRPPPIEGEDEDDEDDDDDF